MYTGDKVFYGLKMSKNKIFKLLFKYICNNELQNYIYDHELFKKSYIIEKDSNNEINTIGFNNINLNYIALNYENDNKKSDDDKEESDDDKEESDDDKENDKPQNQILLNIYKYIIDDDDRLKNMILLLFKILSFKYLIFLYQSCCDNKGIIFLGIELGRNYVTYRGIIDEYKNFNDYYNDFTNNILIMKKNIEKNKKLYDKQFKKLNIKPKIYSMANDCYRCT